MNDQPPLNTPYHHDFNPAQGKDPCANMNPNLMTPRKDANSMQDTGSSLAPSETLAPIHPSDSTGVHQDGRT